MQITLDLPDEIGGQLASGPDLSRAVLEALVAEGCREHRISDEQAARLLGVSRYELDGILKSRGVLYDYDLDDVRQELKAGDARWETRQSELHPGQRSVE